MSNDGITWITCPDCGKKIGVVISVGKTESVKAISGWPPETIEEKLMTSGVNMELVELVIEDENIIITPKRFLGDLWGQVNDSIRSLGGTWIRAGRDSHWKIEKSSIE
jgi:hypothetical protein